MKRIRNLRSLSFSNRFLHISTRRNGKGEELRDVREDTLKSHFQPSNQAEMLGKIGNALNSWIIGEANFRRSFKTWGKTGYWKGTCLRLLPNIRVQQVVTDKIVDYLKQNFNISWKLRTINLWGWRNRKHNKYLRAMYKRLETARSCRDLLEDKLCVDGNLEKLKIPGPVNHKYWNLAYFLITHSVVFQVLHMNKVLNKDRTWPGRESLDKVVETMNKVKAKLVSSKWMEIEVYRVWIDDSKRPLGVPTLADRIIGSMFSNLLEFYLWDSVKVNHGYQTGKGSGTAWRKILGGGDVENPDGLIRYPYIWEYDLDGCFNRLNQQVMGDILRSLGLPSWLWMSLLRMQKRSPKLYAGSGGRVEEINVFGKVRQRQIGSSKKFEYWNEHNLQGVAQGHSLSPLLSLIMIEHANRSFMKREDMRGNHTIGYADDGIFFTVNKFPIKEYARHIGNWGMLLSLKKCSYVREAWNWNKPLKFLGLLYNPFIEKLQAHTRKGSRVILEDSISRLFSQEGFVGVERGIFHREERYDRLGEWKEFDEEQIRREVAVWIILGLFSCFHWIFIAPTLYYLVKRKWIHYVSVIICLGMALTGWEDQLWIVILIWISAENMELIKVERDVYYGKTQQITWRLVIREKKLNAFVARLYNGQMANNIIPQNFKLQVNPHSLLWHLKNTESAHKVWRGWDTEKIEVCKTYAEIIEEDMDKGLYFANATSVGCHVLIEYLSSGNGTYSGPPSPSKLKRILISRMNLGGYWSEIEDLKAATVPILKEAFGLTVKNTYPHLKPSEVVKLWDKTQGKELWDAKLGKIGPVSKIAYQVDWVHQISDSWRGMLKADRHRWVQPWPNPSMGSLMYKRIYDSYRLHQSLWLDKNFMNIFKGTVKMQRDPLIKFAPVGQGWVPIIRRKKKFSGTPRIEKPRNHLYVTDVPYKTEAKYEATRKEYFRKEREALKDK